jgi:hypothetical protein
MALQFFSVHSEALAFTHDSLRRHAAEQGQRPPGPTRALRVAQLYGHLQLRAAGRRSFSLPLCELATSWRLQPRQLRQDLALLQSLGWLEARGTTRGTHITLHDPSPTASAPHASAPEAQQQAAAGGDPDEPPAVPLPGLAEPHGTRARPSHPRAPRPSGRAVPRSDATPPADRALLDQLSGLYNQHRPPSWPAYQPRGTALLGRIGQALRHAGGPDALAAALRAALTAMPSFWRTTYPQGRSGAECFSALFQADRANAALGVEFWHLFHWSQAAAGVPLPRGSGSAAADQAPGAVDGLGGEPAEEAERLARARRLLVWDAGLWRAQGREALHLSQAEKRDLTRLLEARGIGIPGSADRQFPVSETAVPTSDLTALEPSPTESEPEPDPMPHLAPPASRRPRRQHLNRQALARQPTPPARHRTPSRR